MQRHDIPTKNQRILECSILDETVIYNLATSTCMFLNPSATHIWDACDGRRDVGQIVQHTGYPHTDVLKVIEALSGGGLLNTHGR